MFTWIIGQGIKFWFRWKKHSKLLIESQNWQCRKQFNKPINVLKRKKRCSVNVFISRYIGIACATATNYDFTSEAVFCISLWKKKEQTLHRSYLIYTVNISSTLVINTTIGSIINTTRQHCQRCMPVWFAFSEKSIKMTLSPILSFHSKCKINFVLR